MVTITRYFPVYCICFTKEMVGKTFCVILQIVLNSSSLNKRDEIQQNQAQKKVSQNDAGVETAYVRGCGKTILSFMSNRKHAPPNREAAVILWSQFL